MRGGVSSDDLMHHIDVNDMEIISSIVEENIETVKKSGMPLI